MLHAFFTPILQAVSKKNEAVVFGPSLAAIRKSRNIPQRVLAARAQVSEGLLANLEAGHRQPSRSTLDALAVELGVPVEAIGLYIDADSDQLRDLLPDLVVATRAAAATGTENAA